MKISKIKYEGNEYPLNNIVIIIGGNNAGKTKLLQSLYDEMIGLVEVRGVEYSRSSYRENYWPNMFEAGYFEYSEAELARWRDSQQFWRIREEPGLGGFKQYRSDKYILQMLYSDQSALKENVLEDLKANRQTDPPTTEKEWIIPFKKSHIQELPVDQRFNESNRLTLMDIQSIENSPYILYTEKYLLERINQHLLTMFKKRLAPIMATINSFALLAVPPEKVKTLPKWVKSSYPDVILKMTSIHQTFFETHKELYIGEQSHGTRAALSLLMSLSDKTRKILFIDEPEIHLYPTNRRYIAKIIAESSNERQFFLVTHDPLSIDGIASSRKDFTIIKVSNDHKLKIVNFNSSKRKSVSSELKNLDSIRAGFMEAALFVEGGDDKYLYGSIISRRKMIPDDLEFGIVDCGGGDKISAHIKFAAEVGTKVAAIIDFDVIAETKMDRKYGKNTQKIVPLMDALHIPSALINEAKELKHVLAANGMSKTGLLSASVPQDVRKRVERFIDDCSKYGLFIVPNGEAYSWLGKKKEDGPVEYLRNVYFNRSSKFPEVTNFLTKVTNFLKQ